MNIDPQVFEIGKLAAQLSGALLIAWLTVKWALRRFQREKSWERRFNAYADALTALSEMRLIVGLEIDDEMARKEASKALTEERTARYKGARRQLDQVVAVSGLLFSKNAAKRMADVPREIDKNAEGFAERGSFEVLDSEYGLLTDAMLVLRHDARTTLGLETGWERFIRKLNNP